MNNYLQNIFSGWRVSLAIFIGLSVSLFLLLNSVYQESFIEAENGSFIWHDANVNGQVDYNDPNEFKSVEDGTGTFEAQSFGRAISQIEWGTNSFIWLTLSILFMFGRDLFYMLRIRILTDKTLSWRSSFYVIMIWEFASTLTPGVVGGAAVAMFILKREGLKLGRSTAIVIITAFMDNLFYILLIPFVLLTIGNEAMISVDGENSTFLQWWFWVGFIIIFGVALLLMLSIFWWPSLVKFILSYITKIPFLKRWHESAKKTGEDVRIASIEFRQKPFSFWLKTFGATFGSWMSRYLVVNAILAAFLDIGLIDHVHIIGKQLVLWLFMLVSPTPGGSGVAEFAFGELLAGFSSSAILLAALAILWRMISYFPYLFIGAILLPRWLRAKRK
jgi:uncharacterized protein (TIRG00374 family)